MRRRNGDRKWITEEEETFNAFSLQGGKKKKKIKKMVQCLRLSRFEISVV